MNPAPGTFNCHYFARRMMGIKAFTDGLSRCDCPGYAPEPLAPHALELGQPYGFVQSGGHLVHSVIGMGDGKQCLSVSGWGKPIVIADTEPFHFIYYGRFIHRMLPETINRRCLKKEDRRRYRHHGRQLTPAQSHHA